MSDNPAARAARKVLEDRHRAELDAATQKAKRWRDTSIAIYILTGVVFIGSLWISYDAKRPWNTDTPPVEQKLKVVTYGWYSKKKGWCSYDTGQQITVQEWQP